jgi:hypothetical protein
MIRDFFFVVRMLGLTVLVALALQTKAGEKTVEETFHQWIKTSVFVDFIQGAVDGGVALTKTSYKSADTGIKKVLAKLSKRPEKAKDRSLTNFQLKRYNDDDDEDFEDSKPPAPHAKSAAPQVK